MASLSSRELDEAAERAIRRLDVDDPDRADIANPGNLLVYYFLMEMHMAMVKEGPRREMLENFASVVNKAYKTLQVYPMRCHDMASLMKVTWIGETIANRVKKYLWSKQEAEPLTEDEQAVLATHK